MDSSNGNQARHGIEEFTGFYLNTRHAAEIWDAHKKYKYARLALRADSKQTYNPTHGLPKVQLGPHKAPASRPVARVKQMRLRQLVKLLGLGCRRTEKAWIQYSPNTIALS